MKKIKNISKKTRLIILGLFLGMAGSVFAATWQTTNWISDGSVISANKTKENFDYLYERIDKVGKGGSMWEVASNTDHLKPKSPLGIKVLEVGAGDYAQIQLAGTNGWKVKGKRSGEFGIRKANAAGVGEQSDIFNIQSNGKSFRFGDKRNRDYAQLHLTGKNEWYIKSKSNGEFGIRNAVNGVSDAIKIVSGSSNKVGINMGQRVSPRYNLDVKGDINFTGRLMKNGVEIGGGSGSGVPNLAAVVAAGNNAGNRDIHWAGSMLSGNQGGSIELGNRGTPFIDFHNDATSDYDIRLILENDNTLSVKGGNLKAKVVSSSDRRLKENIRKIENPLEKIQKINGVKFDWKNKEKYSKRRQVGVIAQDVEKVFPELVETEKTGEKYKSVNYAGLVSPLIEAIKELNLKIENQSKEIERLKKIIEKK